MQLTKYHAVIYFNRIEWISNLLAWIYDLVCDSVSDLERISDLGSVTGSRTLATVCLIPAVSVLWSPPALALTAVTSGVSPSTNEYLSKATLAAS